MQLSMVMKNIPMGITYASFAGLTIIATVVVGIFRFDPDAKSLFSNRVSLHYNWSFDG
jgi:multidrug transporter EmrE-like cation transporter